MIKIASFEMRMKLFIQQILHLHEKMKFTKWKLLPILLLILSISSITRFLKITLITTTSPPSIHHHISYPSTKLISLTEKETKFLLKFFSHKVPCNLLIFGHENQYAELASLNKNGFTIFLNDNRNPVTTRSANNTRVYSILHKTKASEAYDLLRDARQNPDCTLHKFYPPKVPRCNLELSNLPSKVYDTKWDVIIVDGPSGDTPDFPGRMAVIYTVGVLARRGGTTNVIVHDVNRMIEKWFSWEFLCQENLVSSKGRFWNFQITGEANVTKFCVK